MCLTKKTNSVITGSNIHKHMHTYAHWFLSETKITCCRFRQLNRDAICVMCSQIMTIQFGKQTTLLQLRHLITVHSVTLHHNIPSSCLATHQCFLQGTWNKIWALKFSCEVQLEREVRGGWLITSALLQEELLIHW